MSDPEQPLLTQTLSQSAGQPAGQPSGEPPARPRRDWREVLRRPWTLVLLALLLIVAWQWYESHARMEALRGELAARLRDSDADSRDARLVARQALEAVREAQTKIAQMDARLTESQNQQVALEAMYQELARNRDESMLAEVDQVLTIASQQLQLAGNVQAAIIALQTADQRLARGERPQFIPLRKVLARDQERLKGTPNIDLAGLILKIDQVIGLVDTLPLAGEERLAAAARQTSPQGEDSWWRRLTSEVWNDMKSLVRIQVSDAPDPGLLAPNQAFFLRENLKLRLLNARLSLLSRDQATFREDMKTANDWIARWFDARSKATQAAQSTLRQLNAAAIQIEVPSIADSLNAVRNYKVARDRGR